MLLIVALLGLLSVVSATVDRLIVHPDNLADYNYFLKVENHTVTAVLANGTVIHDNADPCTSRTNYQVGKEYFEEDCPAPVKYMNTDGLCDVRKSVGSTHKCISFCQVRTTYYYEKETPWEKHYCHGPKNCQLSSGAYMSFRSRYHYPGMENVYISDVSGGWKSGDGGVFASPGQTRQLSFGSCGYWTFISIIKRACGSTSRAIANQDLGANDCLYDNIWDTTTTANDCVDQNAPGPYHSDYTVGGKNVFVYISCMDFHVLPSYQQDDAYNNAVKLSQDDLTKKLMSWVELACDLWGTNNKDGKAIYIQGKGLVGSQIGRNGEVLYNGIKGRCGMPDSSRWSYKWVGNDDDVYEWDINVPVSDKKAGLPAAWQCVLDYFGDLGAPRKNQATDCKLHT